MIDVQSVSKSYGSIKALDQVNFQIKEGSCFGLVGPNGAGKSTLMKILVGVLLNFDGNMQISNYSIRNNRLAVKKLIGYVPQEICLEETLTTKDNLRLFGKLYGLSNKQLNKRIQVILEQIGLTERANDKILSFSGGMKRRLNMGCALLHEPKVIVLDEPTVGIDPQSRRSIFKLIEELNQTGSTIIYSSHYMEEVEQLCDSVGFIDQGKLVEHGAMNQVINKYHQTSIFVKGESITAEFLSSFGDVKKHSGGGCYTIDCIDPLDTMGKMIISFKDKGLSPDKLALSQLKLEDIFFDITGTQLRDT